MPKLDVNSISKYGYNNMRTERIKNIGTPKFGTDAMPWAVPNYTTTMRNLIPSPTAGVIILNTTINKIQAYVGGSWVDLN